MLNKLDMYKKVGAESVVEHAQPKQIIQLLLGRAIEHLLQAKVCMQQTGKIAEKGMAIVNAMDILIYLQGCLDFQNGGKIAMNLNRLYDYSLDRLGHANRENKPQMIDEALKVLQEIKTAWDAIV